MEWSAIRIDLKDALESHVRTVIQFHLDYVYIEYLATTTLTSREEVGNCYCYCCCPNR